MKNSRRVHRELTTLVLGISLALALGAAPASATIYHWQGGDGDWSNTDQWDNGGGPPGPGDTAVFDVSGAVTIDSAVEITELDVTEGSTVALDVSSHDLTVDSQIFNNEECELEIDGGDLHVTGLLSNQGTLVLDAGTLTTFPVNIYAGESTGVLELMNYSHVNAGEIFQKVINGDETLNIINASIREFGDDAEINIAPGGLLGVHGDLEEEDYPLNLTITGDVAIDGGVDVEAGADVTMTGNLTVSGRVLVDQDATFTIAGNLAVAGQLELESDALVTIAENDADGYFVRLGSLNILGTPDDWEATLDINDNYLIVDNLNGTAAAATYTRINNQIHQGFDSGAWGGYGIISNTAKNYQLPHDSVDGIPVMIGVVNNDNGSGGAAFYTTFAGQSVSGTDMLVRYTWFGDADLSGVVDAVDYSFFATGAPDTTGTYTGWEWGDFDYSGTIDTVDYNFFVFGVQKQSGPVPPPLQGAPSRAQPNANGLRAAAPVPAILQRLGIVPPSADELDHIIAKWLVKNANMPDYMYVPPQFQSNGHSGVK